MNKDEILDKIKEIQPSYLKEWNIGENDPGLAISEVFSDMLSELYQSYSTFPNKLLMTYFDKLNFTQKAPLAATAPVTFKLTENIKKGVVVPKYTKLSTEDKIVFETMQSHMITSSNLIYLYDIRDNKYITNHTKNLETNEDIVLFSNTKQEHYIYFGDDNLFNIHKEIDNKLGRLIGLEYIVPLVRNGKWEYFGRPKKDADSKWNSFFHISNSNKLNKEHPYRTEKTVINGIETYWIRVKIDNHMPSSYGINFRSSSEIDGLFHNTAPIKESSPIYPFGQFSQVNDLFYIASSEAFSKVGFTVEIEFFNKQDNPKLLDDKKFSWEYWNSKAWKPLPSNSFVVPSDITKTVVNGEENYWIRIRLLDNTEYIKYSCNTDVLQPIITPLELRRMKINVLKRTESIKPKHIIQYKDLEYQNYPFVNYSLESDPLVYFGFSKAFEFGLISLYIQINEESQSDKNILKWQIYDEQGWSTLNVKDETSSFIKSGFIQFISEANQKENTIFGKTGYWIRAIFDEDSFVPRKINAIYTNTINVRQSKTVNNVLLGSSDGSGLQEFTLNDINIFNLKLWVLEDIEPLETESFKDKFDDGYWVLWTQINHLHNVNGSSRVYEKNSHLAKIKFGDDRNGKIPPLAKDNIMVSYSIGGGVVGNVKEKDINTLVDTVAYIDSIENPIEASGGADIQSIDNLKDIGVKRFKHKFRAVTDEDFYYLVKEASSDVAKVSVLSSRGLVKLSFIPYGSQKIPMPSLGLKNLIFKYISIRASALTKIEVITPEPITLSVQVEILLSDWDYATNIKNIINEELNMFLHPINGSSDKKGWEFTQLPLLSDVYKVLSQIEGIYKVSTLDIALSNGKGYSLSSQKMPILNNNNIICSGNHIIDIIYDEGVI